MLNNSNWHLPLIRDSFGNVIGQAGDRLKARHPLFDHVGTLNEYGLVWANSSLLNGVFQVDLETFRGGAPILNLGHIGPLSRQEVLLNYKGLKGTNYKLFSKNCEHVDNFARGLPYRSPQIESLINISALALTGLLVACKKNY